ncbi:MAG: RdgB/HAM1 family non-canonical purine NTP pyrophosphatase [Pseudomonadota bacterium]
MRRWTPGKELVLASHNPGKVREIAELLKDFDLQVLSAGDLGLPEPEETGTTFAENAALKAHAAAQGSGKAALADDSGLCVNALDGAPGIYSARWAGPEKSFDLAMNKVEEALAGKDDRRAYFICHLCLAWPDGAAVGMEGRIDGNLTWPPRGKLGFGYDPIFVPEGHDVTFGEMEPDAKHAMSHRARAFEQLVDHVFQAPPS